MKRKPPFSHIVIVGVGLIGGSLGLAIKRRFPQSRVVGVDKPAVLRRALARKAIDRGETRLSRAVRQVDLVILSTPIRQIVRLLPRIAKACRPQTLITDVGSVKVPVLRAARKLPHGTNFLGGHPMSGVELSGVQAAHPLLFENAVYVLTPPENLPRPMLTNFSSFVRQLGARPMVLDPVLHDQVAAVVSHVPQLTAVALMNVAGRRHPGARKYLGLAAGGFRDLTRIASSRYDLWAEILPANRSEISRSLRMLLKELRHYDTALKLNEDGLLRRKFRSARKLRSGIPADMKGFLHPMPEIQVFVEDRPGVLARLTTVLARAGLNIKDIALMKVREGRGGTFRLAFDSADSARRAANILQARGFEVGDDS